MTQEIDKDNWLDYLKFRVQYYSDEEHFVSSRIEKIYLMFFAVFFLLFNVESLFWKVFLVVAILFLIIILILMSLYRLYFVRLCVTYDFYLNSVMSGKIPTSELAQIPGRIEEEMRKANPKWYNKAFEKGSNVIFTGFGKDEKGKE